MLESELNLELGQDLQVDSEQLVETVVELAQMELLESMCLLVLAE